MQFVNDDMDDDQFRRAAEEYPLNTDKGDWNKVLEKMQAEGVNVPQKKKNRTGLLLLLTLIPLLLICTTYIKNDSATNDADLVRKNTTVSPNAGSNKDPKTLSKKNEPLKIAKGSEQLNNGRNEVATLTKQNEILTSRTIKETRFNTPRSRTNNDIAIAENTDKNL